ncbi:unnamed protein product [Nezara viridula]|uniref:Uncharacterized protein n=1 Tax=Nezara viridula TaxID=85310 RepID=A0A9P0MW47_NEZVI|nr:unnamed protein product [Nezara viridula]
MRRSMCCNILRLWNVSNIIIRKGKKKILMIEDDTWPNIFFPNIPEYRIRVMPRQIKGVMSHPQNPSTHA